MGYYDASSVALVYTDLDANKEYQARVVFNVDPEPLKSSARAKARGATTMRLVANGNTTVWPPGNQQYAPPPFPVQVCKALPHAAV